MHGVQDFFNAVYNRRLPASGGVFYLRGGYNNNDGLTPIDKNPLTANQSSATTITRPIRTSRSPRRSPPRRSPRSRKPLLVAVGDRHHL